MSDGGTISDVQGMSFDELLEEIDAPSPTEIVAVAVFYLKVAEDNRGWIRQQQIRDTLATSNHPNAKIAIDHVHTEIRNLDDFGYLRYSPSGGLKYLQAVVYGSTAYFKETILMGSSVKSGSTPLILRLRIFDMR